MKRYIIALGFVLLPVVASAEPYSPTLSAEEQERHEFIDAQKNNYPSGKAESASTAPRPQPTDARSQAGRAGGTASGTQQ
ncbi:hypothetical protein V5F44_11540 [Xanthobacter sp. V2C-8]|uniref:hypothetical protein n=1 Tax=Xanthobacter albus TaxID=3119929 RepID=UPI00372AE865